jgi:hypothetical protein
MEKLGSGILDKHSGSATLPIRIYNSTHHPLFSLCSGLGKTPLTGSSFLDNSYSLAGSEVLLEVGI